MTQFFRSARLVALSVSMMLVAVGCAPTPSASPIAEPQPAATEAKPAEASPTEAPAAAEATAAPAAEEPTTAVATEAPVVATEAPAVAGGTRTFVIVPGESQAGYEVDEEFLAGAADRLGIQPGKGKTIGSTDQVNGQLTLDFSGATPQLTSGEFQVNISTLKSNQNRRDNRIRSEWLQSTTFPIASFKATGIQNGPASYTEGEEVSFQLAGDLTIREITQPVVFDVTATLSGDTITGTATTAFLMSQFGVDPPALGNLLTVGDNTVVKLTLVAKEE